MMAKLTLESHSPLTVSPSNLFGSFY